MTHGSFSVSKALLKAFRNSSIFFTEEPLPPNISVILSYFAVGERVVGGILKENNK